MVTRNSCNTWIGTTVTNEVIQPAQPAFFSYLGTSDNNVTGNNIVFIIGNTTTGTALTEVFDQNSDFNPGGASGAIFTAPVTGRYFLEFSHQLDQVATGTDWRSVIRTSNRNYISRFDPFPGAGLNEIGKTVMVLADMDAADIAYCDVNLSNIPGNTADVIGGVNCYTRFSGYLVC